MKKRLLAMALCICTALSVGACGKNDEDNNAEGKLTLGEYKGIKVDASLEKIEQKQIDAIIEEVIVAYTEEEEIKEGILAEGDNVKVSYKSTIDGKEYKSSEGETYKLTDGEFIVDGFVEGLIGHSVGDKVELDLVLPTDFWDTANAGKAIKFNVTIEAKVNEIVPEYNDEFIKTNFAHFGLETKDDFVEYTKEYLIFNQVYAEIWQEVLDNSTAESYDSKKLDERAQLLADEDEYYIYTNFGVGIDEYLKAKGQTKEEFLEDKREKAKTYVKNEMVVEAIAEKEKIAVTDEYFQEKMLQVAIQYGFDTIEEFEEAYKDSYIKTDYEFSFLEELVARFVCENVEFVEGYGLRSEKETSSENSSETATKDSTETTTEATTEAATK